MATVEYELFAGVGAVWRHSNGDPYMELDPFFNFGASQRKPGSDRLFLKMAPPQGGK